MMLLQRMRSLIAASVLIYLFITIDIVVAFSYPDYIEHCHRSDPQIAECVKRNYKVIQSHLHEGVKEMGIPPLDPLYMKELQVQASANLNVKLKDAYLSGLSNSELTTVEMDFDKRTAKDRILFKSLELNATYDISGQILFLPIEGHGKCYIHLTNFIFNLLWSWDLYKKPNDDREFARVTAFEISFEPESAYFNFDNLFNGNKELGDQTNAFINENWREFSKDIQPAVSQTIGIIMQDLSANVVESVPFDHILFP